MKILVVDDDIYINKMITKVLEREKHSVFSASNGNEALKILEKNPGIDLLITDIIMPEKEGIETIVEIRKVNKKLRIIAISGGGKLEANGYLLLAKKLGADEIIAKPFDDKTLLETVEKVHLN